MRQHLQQLLPIIWQSPWQAVLDPALGLNLQHKLV